MKCALANALVACLAGFISFALTGCGANVAGTPAPAPMANGDVPRNGTNWPTGSTTPAPEHRPYPIVLVHGFSGFHNIGPINYFYGVQDALSKDGHQVYVPVTDPYNSSEIRGAELEAQVNDILLQSGALKVNLICHSQGALDCRLVANHLGAKIASVTTVAGVHRGTYVADVASGAVQGPAGDALNAILKILGDTVLDPGGNPKTDAKAAIAQLTTAGCDAFNAKYPDDPQVSYFSIAGRTNNKMGDYDCGPDLPTPFIGKWDTVASPGNPLLAPTTQVINSSATVPPTNDGLVSVASARWGSFLGCVPADHFSEICQIGGQNSGSSYSCVTMYRDIAGWLVSRGF
jgi:triacylglycerol lipase